MKKLLLLVMAVVLVAGCKNVLLTHQQERQLLVEQRHKEIDEAFTRGDITEIQRQELKNQMLRPSLVIPADK